MSVTCNVGKHRHFGSNTLIQTCSRFEYLERLMTMKSTVQGLGLLLMNAAFFTIIASTYGSIHFAVDPTHISPGLTSSFTVNCTFNYGNASDVSILLSLIISKQETINNGKNQTFQEIISLNTFSDDHVSEIHPVEAQASGHIEANDDGYISLRWTYPVSSVAGLYRCEAHVLDNTGHPGELIQMAQVTSQQPTLDILVKEVGQLQSRVTSLTLKQQQDEKKRDEMTAAMFEKSSVYENHYYLLSKQHWRNADVAEVTCEHSGGYLAEIDNAAELDFVANFFDAMRNMTRVLIGSFKRDGSYIFRFIRRPVDFFTWYSGEPSGRGDCMILYRENYGQRNLPMFDNSCYDMKFNYFNHLCEVPL